MGREERDNIEVNQIQFDSATQEHQQRQKSLSPILIVSPNLRQIHQEQAESSEHHDNNTELMEMLKAISLQKNLHLETDNSVSNPFGNRISDILETKFSVLKTLVHDSFCL